MCGRQPAIEGTHRALVSRVVMGVAQGRFKMAGASSGLPGLAVGTFGVADHAF